MRWKNALVMLGFTLCLALGAEEVFDDDDDDGSVTVSDENENLPTEDHPSKEDEVISYESPIAEKGKFFFAEHFDEQNRFLQNWIKSQAKKDDIAEEIAKYDGVWENELPQKQILKNDFGLVLKSKAKHAAISSRLKKPFVFNDKPLVVQYEVTMQTGQECGGSYIKLLSSGKDTSDLTKFNDKTPYTIMFGPDKCGNDVKLHFIFRHVNPLNGSIMEKHCRKPKERLEEPFKDKEPHLYQLLVNPDNTFKIRVDHRVINEGSLLTDFNPPVNPPREIDDPNDKRPENWDEREKIPDPDAKKPDDWDESAPPQIPDPNAVKPDGWLDDEDEMIPDSNAQKPEDWDVEMDGEWEAPLVENPICDNAVGCGLWKAPLIPNPDYKGKWRAPLIENPNYQGKWVPKKIPNPEFFEDLNPFKMTTIDAIGIELWSMSSDILFDNIVITDDEEAANEWAAKTYDLKRRHIDKASESFFSKIIKLTNENPWLIAVYIIVVGVPLTFIIYTLCFSKDKKNKARAEAKKTDEPQPDDEEEEEVKEVPQTENESKDTENEAEVATEESASPKHKKSDLDVDKIENVGDNEGSDEKEIDESISDEGGKETEETTNVQPSNESNTDGARKRQKSRKE